LAPGEPRSGAGFIWPITVAPRITNYMTARHPLGIDMGLSHVAGTPIRAVAEGKVVFAGGNTCCSYGLYVIVDHENGLKTLYAHLSRLDVSNGQRVRQGENLGPSGRTGYSTGVHLHFEVHRNGVRVNPMNYLP
jgi:murein DD-endopeptidase MepM/ murein hydrolase activator NlpD